MTEIELQNAIRVNEMSRGFVVVDENLESLGPYLLAKKIKVIVPPKGTPDDHIQEKYLPGRIFITNNTKDFTEGIIEQEYGVISTEAINSKDPAKLADMISKAIIRYKLWALKHGFVLKLSSDSKHQLKMVTE